MSQIPADGVDAPPQAVESEDDAAAEARRASRCAVRLLSKRDHSTVELRHKLEARDFDEQSVEAAMQEMAQCGYLDDERFAHLFAEQRLAKGHGPRAIRAKLQERGIEGSLAKEAIEALAVDWQEMARSALGRRFDAETLASEDNRQRSRMARFLESRGFPTSDSIRAIDDVKRRDD